MNTKVTLPLTILGSAAVIICVVVGIRALDRPRHQAQPARSQLAVSPTSADSSRSEQTPEESRNLERPRDLVDSFRRKLLAQGNVPTFFDNYVQAALDAQRNPAAGPAVKQEADRVCNLFEQLLQSKHNRFCSYEERVPDFCPLTGTKTTLSPMAITMSQGTHSVVKWKQHDVYKTTFDLVLYWMIMDEIKPQVIVELGSGPGGSAIWFADMASALGFATHVYSYDIVKPDISYPNVTFIQFDLETLSSTNPLPFKERFIGTTLVSEDAHVNVTNVLLEIDSIMSTGDYLIVEDSSVKQKDISDFLALAKHAYRIDRYYLDFFGKNGGSCMDSIFKVF